MKFKTTVTGIKDVDELLSKIAPHHALNIMRATVHGVAGVIAKDAKASMPVDEGDMRRSTKTKRRRMRMGVIRSDVIVLFKAYYWRFLEYGTSKITERAMFAGAVEKVAPRLNTVFREQFGKKLEAKLARERKKQSNGR